MPWHFRCEHVTLWTQRQVPPGSQISFISPWQREENLEREGTTLKVIGRSFYPSCSSRPARFCFHFIFLLLLQLCGSSVKLPVDQPAALPSGELWLGQRVLPNQLKTSQCVYQTSMSSLSSVLSDGSLRQLLPYFVTTALWQDKLCDFKF